MTRIRFINVTREGSKGYRADIVVDGTTVGYVHRPDRSSGLGYRSGDYRAYIDGRTVATGGTLADIRLDLREHFASERVGKPAPPIREDSP